MLLFIDGNPALEDNSVHQLNIRLLLYIKLLIHSSITINNATLTGTIFKHSGSWRLGEDNSDRQDQVRVAEWRSRGMLLSRGNPETDHVGLSSSFVLFFFIKRMSEGLLIPPPLAGVLCIKSNLLHHHPCLKQNQYANAHRPGCTHF